jgi:hypothetical protein
MLWFFGSRTDVVSSASSAMTEGVDSTAAAPILESPVRKRRRVCLVIGSLPVEKP